MKTFTFKIRVFFSKLLCKHRYNSAKFDISNNIHGKMVVNRIEECGICGKKRKVFR